MITTKQAARNEIAECIHSIKNEVNALMTGLYLMLDACEDAQLVEGCVETSKDVRTQLFDLVDLIFDDQGGVRPEIEVG
jgi:hypothetical protein